MDLRMTTRQRNRTKRIRNNNTIRIGTWNIKSWNTKDQEIIIQLNEKKIDICSITETKKKGKGNIKIGNYMLIYSGKDKEKRSTAGVGILIHIKYEQNIDMIEYINERMLQIKLTFDRKILHIFSIYAPDINKTKNERRKFYEDLQNQIDKIPNDNHIIIMGDLNARIGNSVIQGIQQRFNEEIKNDNGDLLLEFCCQNNFRINNTFFEHDMQYKYTFRGNTGKNSVIDYIITNRAFLPSEILDIRTLNSANIGTDHMLVLGKIRWEHRKRKKEEIREKEKLNIELLDDPSIRDLYKNRLQNKIETNSIQIHDTLESAWKKTKENILNAAEESLGKRKIKTPHKGKVPWFTKEVKQLAEEKKKAFLKFRSTQLPEDRENYKQTRNRINSKIRQIKESYWQKFTKGMESDLYGGQRKIWKMIRNRKVEIKDTIKIRQNDLTRWKQYFEELYNDDFITADNNNQVKSTSQEEIEIKEEEITKGISKLKNRKASGPDDINNEYLKYGGKRLNEELIKLFNMVFKEGKVPTEWKSSITIPIYKKGDKKDPRNYRGITLLPCTLKLLSGIIQRKIMEYVEISEQQQGFRHNRSTTDAVFIIRQIVEKAIEYATPVFFCFVDLTKAFDRIRLYDVIKVLREKEVPEKIIRVIEEMNKNTTTKISVEEQMSDEIKCQKGIRQGDSLSPLLFNLIMDKIICSVEDLPGYLMGNRNFNIIAYADDVVLIASTEDDLQRLLHHFVKNAEKYNMKISTEKSKSMCISKEPIRCKLEIDKKMVEQVMQFKYLGVDITSDRHIINEVRNQVQKAARISGCLRDVIWKNKYLNTESKIKIYKTAVRPILTYGTETRAENSRTKQLMRTTEMNTLRTILGKTRLDKVNNETIRQECDIIDVAKFTKVRRREWNFHVERAERNRLIRAARDFTPQGKRERGRPKKRWKEGCLLSSPE